MKPIGTARQRFPKNQLSTRTFSLPVNAITFVRFLSETKSSKIKMLYFYKTNLADILFEPLHVLVLLFVIKSVNVSGEDTNTNGVSSSEDCQVTPVIHVLQYPGCVPKPIPSFACTGRCSSYLQVSGSKIWQMERSCMCCQESGEREASVSLFCPKAKQGDKKFRKVTTKAPLECMCRPCTSVEESAVIPQEMSNYPNEQPINGHFAKPE